MYISYTVKQVPPDHLNTGVASQAHTADKVRKVHNFTFDLIHLLHLQHSLSLSRSNLFFDSLLLPAAW